MFAACQPGGQDKLEVREPVFHKALSDMLLHRYGIVQLCSAPCALLS